MTEQDLRDFAKQPGVDKDAVRSLLDAGPHDQLPEYMLDLDTVVSEEVTSYSTDVYVVWEYRGPLERDEIEDIMRELMRTEEGDEPVSIEVDPLIQADAVLFFCQGEMLKYGITHMDDNSPIYSIYQMEKSTARLWSVGLPFLIREQAAILIDAWRGMLDNAALAAQPQIEINTAIIQRPDDAPPIIEPGAIWERMADAGDQPGLIFHQVPIHQEQYANIIELALRFVDTETNISVLAAGEQGAHTTRTAGGIGLLMNAVNVVFRRVIRNYDDGITMTAIPRAYHYLMQFSPKEEIKGDYTVQARGSSVLLVREIQAQNIQVLVGQALQFPELGAFFNMRNLLKVQLQSMMIGSDEVLKTQQQLDQEAAAAAEQEPPPDPEMIKLEIQRQMAQEDGQLQRELAQTKHQTEMMKLAGQHQMTIEQLQAQLQGHPVEDRLGRAEAGARGGD